MRPESEIKTAVFAAAREAQRVTHHGSHARDGIIPVGTCLISLHYLVNTTRFRVDVVLFSFSVQIDRSHDAGCTSDVDIVGDNGVGAGAELWMLVLRFCAVLQSVVPRCAESPLGVILWRKRSEGRTGVGGTKQAIVSDAQLLGTLATFLGRINNYTVRSPRPVDRGSGGVFQYRRGLDVVGV